MKTLYTVIRDRGDGSQAIEWRKVMTDSIRSRLKDIDGYQSGDGLQIKTYLFQDDFDVDAWAKLNSIYWRDGTEESDIYEGLDHELDAYV